MAACLVNLGRWAEAREAASRALVLPDKRDEELGWALLFNAGLETAAGNWSAALAHLDRLESEFHDLLNLPENRDSLETAERRRGIALCRLGRYAEALPLLERAAALDEEKPMVLYHLGRCCYRLGKLVEAGEHLRAALTFDDLSPGIRADAHYTLGLTYRWRGQAARALEQFLWCLENDKKPTISRRPVLTGIVDAYKALGQDDEAARYSEMLQKE